MADQGWKTGGLNREKYVVRKPCQTCGGAGIFMGAECADCSGMGIRSPRDPDAQYFVLRIDCDPHARAALLVYATSVAADNPQFAGEILQWLQDTKGATPHPKPITPRKQSRPGPAGGKWKKWE